MHDKVFTAKYQNCGKKPRKRFSISSSKKEKLGQSSIYGAVFSSSYERSKSKQQFSGNLALTFPTLFESENEAREKSFNNVASKASYCFLLIAEFFEETELFDTNNKRSHELSEYKKIALFENVKICLHLFDFHIKQNKNSMLLKDPHLSLRSLKLFIR